MKDYPAQRDVVARVVAAVAAVARYPYDRVAGI